MRVLLLLTIVHAAGLLAIGVYLATHDAFDPFPHVDGNREFALPWLILTPAYELLWFGGPATAFSTVVSFVSMWSTHDRASGHTGLVIAWITLIPPLLMVLAMQLVATNRLAAITCGLGVGGVFVGSALGSFFGSFRRTSTT